MDKFKFDCAQFLKVFAAFIVGVIGCFVFSSCGITRATISRPAEGTSTTITITTNNPISTNVSPDVDLSIPVGRSTN